MCVSEYSDEELKDKFNNLAKKGYWDKKCRPCKYPKLFHMTQCLKPTAMERGTEGWKAELWETWSEFRERMDLIVSEYEDEIERSREKLEEDLEAYRQDKEELEKRQGMSEMLIGMKAMSDAYANAITKGNENLIQQLQGRPNKLVKPAKVPSWTKSMKLEAYLKALEVWREMNKDVSEAVRYQDVIESLKINKEI